MKGSSAVELRTVNPWVAGSIPAPSAKLRSVAQSGRVSALEADCQRFESSRSDHFKSAS